MWWKNNKWKVIVPVIVAAVLAVAFWCGGGAPGLQGWTAGPEDSETLAAPSPAPTAGRPSGTGASGTPPPSGTWRPDGGGGPGTEEPAAAPVPSPSAAPAAATPAPPPSAPQGSESRPGGAGGGPTPGAQTGDPDPSGSQGMAIDPNTGKDQYLTDPVPEGRPLPVEPQDVTISDTAHTCTISISCASILDHMDWLDPEKAELVPGDGWILPPAAVTFYEGESVFNVLQRTCKQRGIHLEFVNTPMYNSAYIEGIHNLYEFDCGELSGWMYKVNEWFPNYGCSRYQLQDGDVICWQYTCDLGADIGGFNAIGG